MPKKLKYEVRSPDGAYIKTFDTFDEAKKAARSYESTDIMCDGWHGSYSVVPMKQ